MFAHQVIDDFMQYPKATKEYKSQLDNFISVLKLSQKFHIGNYADLIKSVGQRFISSPVFAYENSIDIKLPYSKCWFDFFSNDIKEQGRVPCNKRGMLVESIPETNSFMIRLAWKPDDGKWMMGFLGYLVCLDKKIIEHVRKNLPYKFPHATQTIIPIPLVPQILQLKPYQRLELMKDDEREISSLNMVLMLLNCKNIGTEKQYPPKALNKKRLKHHKQPIFTYHILVLKPVGKKQESIPRHLWNNRIHLCRGHFKTYTEQNPLFGRITGRFWWQPVVRGRNRNGIVMKDYQFESQQP